MNHHYESTFYCLDSMLTFSGRVVMLLFQADYHRFFGRIGKVPGLLLLLLLQLILGPCGVIPRLVTLMHAMGGHYLFDIPLLGFSILAAIVVFARSFNRERLIGFLGAILTPILLLSLVALVYFGLSGGSTLSPARSAGKDSFLEGLLGGYNNSSC